MPQIPEDMGFNDIGESFSMRRMITSIKVPGERNFPYLTTEFPSRPYKLRRTGLGAEETAILPTGQEITFLPGSGVPQMNFVPMRDPGTYVEPDVLNRISQTPDQVRVVGPGMIAPIDPYRDYKRIRAMTPTPILNSAGKGVAVTPEDFIFTAQTKEVDVPGLPKEMQYQQVPAVERPGPEYSAELYPDEVEAQKADFKKALREHGQDEWAVDGGSLRVSDSVDVASIGQAYPTGPNLAPGATAPVPPAATGIDWGKTAADIFSTGLKVGGEVLAQKYAPKKLPVPAPAAPVFYSGPQQGAKTTGSNLNTYLMIAGGGLAVLGVVVYLMRR
jgi:hypothetical protein